MISQHKTMGMDYGLWTTGQEKLIRFTTTECGRPAMQSSGLDGRRRRCASVDGR